MCLYLALLALQSRMPSMMEAWLRVSLMTASSGPKIASKKPALASKPLGKRIVSSNQQQLAMVLSSCLWMSWVPQMNRTELMPKPWVSRVCLAAWTSLGWLESPRQLLAQKFRTVLPLAWISLSWGEVMTRSALQVPASFMACSSLLRICWMSLPVLAIRATMI